MPSMPNHRSLSLLVVALALLGTSARADEGPAQLRLFASDYYRWRNEQFPVATSDQGLHTGDARLTDYSAGALAARRARVTPSRPRCAP